jgi:hypothetical protein
LIVCETGDGPTTLRLEDVDESARCGSAITVTATCRDAPPELTVSVVVPAARAFTAPALLTEAIDGAPDTHWTPRADKELPAALFGVAVS